MQLQPSKRKDTYEVANMEGISTRVKADIGAYCMVSDKALIEACAQRARAHGAASLGWQTALDNERAQKVYDRVGARRSQWLDYELALDSSSE